MEGLSGLEGFCGSSHSAVASAMPLLKPRWARSCEESLAGALAHPFVLAPDFLPSLSFLPREIYSCLWHLFHILPC